MLERQSKKDYFYSKSISTRWMDNDLYGHVNNVNYYSYFDTVANSYLIERGDLDIQSASVVGFVVASNCEYHAPIAFPQQLDVRFRVNKLGTKSVEYGIAIFNDEREQACATGTFTHVFVERESGESVPIPDNIRRALERAIV